jgi:hypothetical protein
LLAAALAHVVGHIFGHIVGHIVVRLRAGLFREKMNLEPRELW